MEQNTLTTAKLSVVYGTGFLSLSEILQLEHGDRVFSIEENTISNQLCINDNFAAMGKICIIKNAENKQLVFFKIESFEKPLLEAPEMIRNEGLIDFLPFKLVVSQAEFDLDELVDAGIGTLIFMDMVLPENLELPAYLQIAGKELLQGRTIVNIKKDVSGIVLDTSSSQNSIKIEKVRELESGLVLKKDRFSTQLAEEIKFYNWARPDYFTHAQIKALAILHERFCTDIRLNYAQDMYVNCIDQMTWQEIVSSLKSDDRIFSGSLASSKPAYNFQVATEENRVENLIVSRKAKTPVSENLLQKLKDTHGENFAGNRKRVFAIITSGTASNLPIENTFPTLLKNSWKVVSDLRFDEVHELSSENVKILPDEMILIAHNESPTGSISIVYASDALYPEMKMLERYGKIAPF